MYNWSVDTSRLKKNKAVYTKWKLEQMINYGLGREKLSEKSLAQLLPELSIDQDKRKYIEFLLS